MRINNNIAAMNTHRQYTLNTSAVAKSTEKLSSGYRINRAGDDAAGLAISEKMRAQIRGLKMASKNSQDAISLVQTAEGALQETHNILQRMRELATQSASDTNETSIDRAALNAEFQQLIAEIDDTANKTKFNDMGIIDGNYGASAELDSGYTAHASLLTDPQLFLGEGYATGAGTASVIFDDTAGTFTLSVTENGGSAETTTIDLDDSHLKAGAHILQFSDGSTFTYSLKEDVANAAALETALNGTTGVEFDIDVKEPLTIQTGANMGDDLKISIDSMSASRLGVSTMKISSREDASKSITAVNTAINLVSNQRAKLGALQNRLNHKINNLDTSAENLSAAESRIRDLDMAQEMTTFTRNNIITQASTAMLAQANAAPQGVLSLLQ